MINQNHKEEVCGPVRIILLATVAGRTRGRRVRQLVEEDDQLRRHARRVHSPGTGKPAVVIGDKNFTEEYILGDLYQQALQAKGYKVTLKPNIGSSEITYKALKSGQIHMYPEYTGVIASVIAGVTTPPHSAAAAYAAAKAYAGEARLHAAEPARRSMTRTRWASLKSFATKNHLTTISDLKKLGHSLTLGGAPEFATRRRRPDRAQAGCTA